VRSRLLAGCWLLAVCMPLPCAAQQGSLQVTGAAQSVQGDPRRTFGQTPLEPDLGVSWLQPGTRFGHLQMELRGTRRGDRAHLGKALFSLRDWRIGGLAWSLDAGDTYVTPAIGDYRFANLASPSLTFAGTSVGARATRATVNAVVGRATASRNLFGTDPDALDQTLAIVRASFKASDRLELFSRASSVRSGDLGEFTSTIAASDQGGVAARWIVTPAVHLVGDGSLVSYRRRSAAERTLDGSGVAGASFLLSRGWVQVNVTRFSPGELPILSQPLIDRQGLFAAGEIDTIGRVRLFGGWEMFRSNLDPRAGAARFAASDGTRGFAGVRRALGARSSVALRVERGDRRTRAADDEVVAASSDTGVLTAEWQTNVGAVSGLARYSRRENVESRSRSGSYTIDDSSGHLFYSLGPGTQLFGSALATRTATREGGGSTFWQLGGGGQTQLRRRSLWLRAEGTLSRNADILSAFVVPQQSINVGLNGEIGHNTIVGLNVNADRLGSSIAGGDSWMSRSSLRVTRTFSTGSAARVASTLTGIARHSGTGSIAGVVFTDWNANGRQEADETFLENIPIRLSSLGNATTAKDGGFAFTNVPVGIQQVGVDLSALPVDFDPPSIPHLQVQLGRGETKRVAFGLVPLNAVSGSVILDANGNGAADSDEAPVDGAVVVLDAGARSEQVRKGKFRFEAVRSGDHTLQLIVDSLPPGMSPSAGTDAQVSLTRTKPGADVVFLVTRQARPETRRVFAPTARPPDSVASARRAPAAPATAASPAAAGRPPTVAPATGLPKPSESGEGFAIQVVALNDPSRAREALDRLIAEGMPAYLVTPPASDPDAPYRVRVGRYATRADAERAAAVLQNARGQKIWVIRER
jgi:cell division septation protein DedD